MMVIDHILVHISLLLFVLCLYFLGTGALLYLEFSSNLICFLFWCLKAQMFKVYKLWQHLIHSQMNL